MTSISIFSAEALEVDYDPDFSTLDFELIEPESTVSPYPISETQLKNVLPWVDLDSLYLPVGFQIEGYSQIDSSPATQSAESTIQIWTADGYESLVIEITIDKNTALKLNNQSLLSMSADVIDQPISISLTGMFLNPDEANSILQSIAPIK